MTSFIYKAGGILIKDKKILLTRAKNKDFFVAPGGKMEPNETLEDCLIRELQEELRITIAQEDLTSFGTFTAPAAGKEEVMLEMTVYIVSDWQGEIAPSNEVEEVLWYDSSLKGKYKLGSIFEHEVIPKLIEEHLIT